MDRFIGHKHIKAGILTVALLTSILIPSKPVNANGNYDGNESGWVETVMVLFIVFAVGKYTYDRVNDTGGSDGNGLSETDSSSFAIRYMLNPDSMEVFGSLPSEQERKKYIQSFWKRYNSSDAGHQHDLKKEFDTRVLLANRMFTNIHTPGWKTDRGRIFILHGQPSEIITRPFFQSFFLDPINSATYFDYEIWLYDETGESLDIPEVLLSISGGRKFFLFGRISGNTDFEQIYSSERSELNQTSLFQTPIGQR